MTRQFDAYDRASWYFGSISRQEATDLLMNESESGVFLVRDSSSMHGDYVLCVREDSKVSHYIINKLIQNEQVRYRIGDQLFDDLPTLLEFYKIHYLDTTPLIKPTVVQNVTAKFDFRGNDPDDLPFKKGDILTIISKDEDQWWTAKNSRGQIGSIPVPYVQPCDSTNSNTNNINNRSFSMSSSISSSLSSSSRPVADPAFFSTAVSSRTVPAFPPPPHHHRDPSISTITNSGGSGTTGSPIITECTATIAAKKAVWPKKLPAMARVKQVRIPNAYDKTALKLELGDIIKVTKMNINGQWEGELNGKSGNFPFTHVELIESDTNEQQQSLPSEDNTTATMSQQP